jgi:AcrR family transcriptional regulator
MGEGGEAAHGAEIGTLSADLQPLQISPVCNRWYDLVSMGLRERKKEQTRLTIEDAAFRLFAEHGFAATTVADIAEAAVISPRTFFAYFPSKEDVVFAHFDDLVASLGARLDERGPKETTFDALRAWIGELMELGLVNEDREAVRRQLLCDNEALVAHERHLFGRVERVIATSVAADLGDDPEDLRPRLVAAAALAALTSLKPPGAHKDHGRPASPEEIEVLDEAFAFLRGGIAALQRRRAAATATAHR